MTGPHDPHDPHDPTRHAHDPQLLAEHGSRPADDRLNDRTDYQLCFACGARNPSGLGLVFWREGDEIVTEFTAAERYQGFPGVVHGGVIATLLDETLERLGTLEGRWLMTGRLEIRYRRAAPIGRPLRVGARLVSSRARALVATAVVSLAGEPDGIIAAAQGTFLPLPPDVAQHVASAYPVFMRAFEAPPATDPPAGDPSAE
jgi:acyl-coenzyme A thioesterase PaaI-like protein